MADSHELGVSPLPGPAPVLNQHSRSRAANGAADRRIPSIKAARERPGVPFVLRNGTLRPDPLVA